MRLPALIAALIPALILAIAAVTPGLAATFDSPKALLTALYAPYIADGDTSDLTPFFSDRLNGLYAEDAAKTPVGEIGSLDFDPVIAGQDYAISKLQIGAPKIQGDTAGVTVRFDNFDTEQELFYTLVKEKGGWKVDDIESRMGEYPWDLVKIFTIGAGN
ncbi:hypothetical protein Sa4125_42620 [Aureimonas sp. SA4125]|uniref:DUF3828 domain-containing protein n=1 Tax=Aureimonas sp. SA4125 TaxID=2826993 RepID=UPI001CC82940|nr:DUF3828 domain-containing protein [Aureimonas sp. SA4125]BDA86720.1 hypothetical protein Sa4125_42620 [Aureimonas sp. SA4125]